MNHHPLEYLPNHSYNGTPRGLPNCNEGGCPRCNSAVPSGSALDECLCLHAEENALLEAGRERVGEGSILYCNTYVSHSPFAFLYLVKSQVPLPQVFRENRSGGGYSRNLQLELQSVSIRETEYSYHEY